MPAVSAPLDHTVRPPPPKQGIACASQGRASHQQPNHMRMPSPTTRGAHPHRAACVMGLAGMHGKGAQPMSSHCPPDAKCR
eukprot:CAMPEP_0174349562 /NCGR_PEP_ID=MMETSP0811_2-20130205/6318_1 /TAXON_ID=73025 ORGANISM="Eutreptiella gymnastica-like, Strain CCMP1594" /NCGR_SAMPLE_ID=MMETSP0811_2 /ASSEMBLY_ACC=CAM_ASM_000667 /LENGTH=80 /DNA_ID=CAMNT_0015477029 /DNA_START=108 /DNA_END=346 /DNA_ORIENTATION=+